MFALTDCLFLLQLAKLLIVSPEFNCSNEILTIVAMLSGRCHCLCLFRNLSLMLFVQYLTSG